MSFPFSCEKRPAVASRGMVVTNHPLASGAGVEILLAGGNAVDAAVASLFALSVVEPMLVGILGGGVAHIRTADGRHTILDSLSTAPAAATPDMFRVVPGTKPPSRATVDRANDVGPLSVAVPAALAGWCEALRRFGSMPLEDVMRPAIRHAERGFRITHYLADCVSDTARDLAADINLARLFLPDGAPIRPGSLLVQAEFADSLKMIAREGASAVYGGALGGAIADHMRRCGGLITQDDLTSYMVRERAPIVGTYRGHEIVGPPPPASAGVHIVQMLNILEGFDIAASGFATPDTIHLLAEVLKIAFADRAVSTADPDFVDVQVDRIIDPQYAAGLRARIKTDRAQAWTSQLQIPDSRNTTHVTVADQEGNVVASTQTINGVFGACVMVPGTGMTLNNYMYNFDPHPGNALSIAPGKRVFTSMAPMMVRRDGKLRFALGLPGALRIFPSAMQAILNLIDHRMSLQEAVEAPRIWTEGGALELEPAIPDDVAAALEARGHRVQRVRRIAGGMNAIAIDDDGVLTGAACWRADGTPIGIAGGLARPGIRFSI